MVPGLIDLSRREDLVCRPRSPELAPGDLGGHAIRVLESLYRCRLEMANTRDRVRMDYRQLPGAIWQELPDLLGMECSPTERTALQARSGFHSKHTGNPFQGDPLQASDGMLMPTTERLDGAIWCQGQLAQRRHQRNPGRTPSGPRRPGRRAQSDALKADEPGAARVPAPAGPAWPSPRPPCHGSSIAAPAGPMARAWPRAACKKAAKYR